MTTDVLSHSLDVELALVYFCPRRLSAHPCNSARQLGLGGRPRGVGVAAAPLARVNCNSARQLRLGGRLRGVAAAPLTRVILPAPQQWPAPSVVKPHVWEPPAEMKLAALFTASATSTGVAPARRASSSDEKRNRGT